MARDLEVLQLSVGVNMDRNDWKVNYGTPDSEVRADMMSQLKLELVGFLQDWMDRTGNGGMAIVQEAKP